MLTSRRLLFLFALFVCPASASADWLFSGYMGAARTSPNTLTITPASGPVQTLHVADYEGEAFRSPWYFGVRAGWLPHDTRGLGFELEYNHAKAIAGLVHDAQDLNQFQQTHGLNFWMGNAVYRFTPACGGACAFNVRGGFGITHPHVESTYLNVHQEQGQFGGFAWQAGAGVEYHVWQFVYAVGDARLTRVTERHLHGDGIDIAGTFFTQHADFGIALRVP